MQPIDVLVVTVIAPELRACLRAMGFDPDSRTKVDDGTNLWETTLDSKLSGKLRLALSCVGKAGNPEMGVHTAYLLAMLQPKCALLVGIAAGRRDKIKIGNVVLAERTVFYAREAVKREAGQSVLAARPESTMVSHSILQDLAAYIPDVGAMTDSFARVGRFPSVPLSKEPEYDAHVARDIRAVQATVGSGEQLLRDPTRITAISRLHDKIEVLEMEAHGFQEACTRKNTLWLVVRGVSDFGDELKSDEFHEFAATAAAVVAQDFVKNGLCVSHVVRPDNAPGEGSSRTSLFIEAQRSLSAPNAEQQVGALLALEALAVEHGDENLRVTEAICAFLRGPNRATDAAVQAGVSILGRLERLENAPPLDLRGARLCRVHVTKASFRGAILEGADLSGAQLTNADLREANLAGAKLRDANLVDANLRGASLHRADLERCNLERAKLKGAQLELANLRGSWLIDVEACYANLTLSDLSEAILLRADFSHANLMAANLETTLTDVRMDSAWYSPATMFLPGTPYLSYRLRTEILADGTEVMARLKTKNARISEGGAMHDGLPMTWAPAFGQAGRFLLPRQAAMQVRETLIAASESAERVHCEPA